MMMKEAGIFGTGGKQDWNNSLDDNVPYELAFIADDLRAAGQRYLGKKGFRPFKNPRWYNAWNRSVFGKCITRSGLVR